MAMRGVAGVRMRCVVDCIGGVCVPVVVVVVVVVVVIMIMIVVMVMPGEKSVRMSMPVIVATQAKQQGTGDVHRQA